MSTSDEPAVLGLNAAAHPHVAALDTTELRRLCSLSNAHHVIERSGSAIGYALVFAAGDAYDGEEFQLFCSMPGAFTYIDQVVVIEAARGSGVGRRLYEVIEQAARERGHERLCCEVNLAPPNPGSLAFHARLGFKVVRELAAKDGRRVVLLEKKLAN